MSQESNNLPGKPPARPVFVIGTGRSGTHWLGYSLGNHPEVRATIEVQPMFGLATHMAINPTLEENLFGHLIEAYKWYLSHSESSIYIDKTHPNIWLAEKLQAAFPEALFLGIERNPYATVASMMQHKGVSSWHQRWKEFPIPNRFLGITEEMADNYETLPLASQCALRWLAHHNRMNDLRDYLGNNLLLISYETFARDTEHTINALQRFLGLQQPVPVPEVKVESLDKWKSQLSEGDVKAIQDIVGFPPEHSHNG